MSLGGGEEESIISPQKCLFDLGMVGAEEIFFRTLSELL